MARKRLVIAVMVVGPGGTAMVEKFEAAIIDGGCSRASSMEAGDRLLVFHVASRLLLAGVLQELSLQGRELCLERCWGKVIVC